ncbi:MAG: TonB C-terminal domain-containing protein [Bacteroidota bacterium]
MKYEKMKDFNFVCELMPDFERNFRAESKTHTKIKDLLQINQAKENITILAQDNYVHARAEYEKLIDYVSIEIVVKSKGEYQNAKGTSHALNKQQKELLLMADLGTDIVVKLKFKYKEWISNADKDDGIKEAEYTLTVIPNEEAMMNGGYTQFSDYLNEHLVKPFPGKSNFNKIAQAAVQFSVNDKGEIIMPKLIRSSSDKKIDQAILKVISNMKHWNVAKNAQGLPVQEEFTVSLGGGGC